MMVVAVVGLLVRMPAFRCALDHDVRKLFNVRLAKNSEHARHPFSARKGSFPKRLRQRSRNAWQ